MWERLISFNPNFIKYYNRRGSFVFTDELLAKKALDNGYLIVEEDLKKNKFLSSSKVIMEHAISINSNFIKYYSGNYYQLIDDAINSGYKPNIEDLKNNSNLGKSDELIKCLIENGHPEAIRFYDNSNNLKIFKLALKNGYQITEEDLKTYNLLCSSFVIMKKAISINPNFIKYYSGNYYQLIDDAINNGYKPNIEDLKNNPNLGESDELIKYLIENGHPEAIILYKNVNEEVFELALKNGYLPLKKHLIGSNIIASDCIMRYLIRIDNNLILYYCGENEGLFEEAYNLGFKEKKIIKAVKHYHLNLLKSKFIMKKILDYDRNVFEKYFCLDLDMAVTVGYVPSQDLLLSFRDPDFRNSILEKVIFNEPSYIKYYNGDNYYVYMFALERGYLPSEDTITNNFIFENDVDIIGYILKLNNDYLKYFKEYELIYKILVCDYVPSLEELKNNSYAKKNYQVIKKLCEIDPKYIECVYFYYDKYLKLFIDLLDCGYRPELEFLNNHYELRNDYEVVKKLIEKDLKYIVLISEFNEKERIELYDIAYDCGYRPQLSDIQNDITLTYSDKIMEYFINLDCNNIVYYSGDNIKIFELVLKNNYEVFSLNKILEINDYFEQRNMIILYLIKNKDFSILSIFSSDYATFKIAIELGYIPKISEIDNYNYECINNELLKKIIINSSVDECFELIKRVNKLSVDIQSFILKQNGIDISLEYLSVLKSFKYNKIDFIKNYESYRNFLDQNYIKESSFIKYGFNVDFDWLSSMINIINNGKLDEFCLVKEYFFDNYYIDDGRNEELEINNFINIIKNYENYSELCLNLTKNKNELSEEIKYNLNILFSCLYDIKSDYKPHTIDDLECLLDNYSIEECVNLVLNNDFSGDIKLYILEKKGIDISLEYLDILNTYGYDKNYFLVNYQFYVYFLRNVGIDQSKFIKYGFNVDFDWFKTMMDIINNRKLDEFNSIKELFYKYMKSNSEVTDIKLFINLLINYQKYPELCVNILRQDKELSQELIDNIKFLFNSTDSIVPSLIKTIDDLSNIKNIFMNKYLNTINSQMSLNEIKNIVCQLLFNMNLDTVNNKLNIYGDTRVLRQLIFNNRNNTQIIDLITEMMIYTSMMEAIVFCNDLEYLVSMGKNILDNYELSINCMMLFDQFDEKMRILYEKELITNLTVLNDNVDGLLDKDMSEKCGVDVIDFSKRKYCLIYHVKSDSETSEELVNGISTVDKNTICLSVGSNRNQIVYHRTGLIFATDEIPEGVFIRSSVSNMGSNGSILKGSFRDRNSNNYREQRGALETSIAPFGNNSEVLCFRSGVKFKYIILPGGRNPSRDEVLIAKRYGLKFIKTQELYKSIDNPQDIESTYLKRDYEQSFNDQIQKLKKIKEELLKKKPNNRKIAIFTDSHALFEPTLAILEDARKNGISEIYSLGDNIGTGPNPKEVMELLSEYGVQSLKGNHEIYATLGVDRLEKHLKDVGAYEEALRNSSWTRSQLTQQQISEINNNPEERIIEIGGEKILLIHFSYDYNTGDMKRIPSGINAVFQGHIHFEREFLNGVVTLRGAGIGNGSSDEGKAYYIILTERADGGYDIEKRIVPFDRNNLKYDILESSMDSDFKSKIESWVGIKR